MCVLIFNTLIIFKDLEIREPSLIISVPLPAIVGGALDCLTQKKGGLQKKYIPQKGEFSKIVSRKKGVFEISADPPFF